MKTLPVLALLCPLAGAQVQTGNWQSSVSSSGSAASQSNEFATSGANAVVLSSAITVSDSSGTQYFSNHLLASGTLTVTGDRLVSVKGLLNGLLEVEDINDSGDNATVETDVFIGSNTLADERYALTSVGSHAVTNSVVETRVALRAGTYDVHAWLTLRARIGSEAAGTTNWNRADFSSNGWRVEFTDLGPLPAPIGTPYCPVQPHSSGVALLTLYGSGEAGDLILAETTTAPPNQFGMVVTSATQGFFPGAGGSQGNLCVAGQIYRYRHQIFFTGQTGSGVSHLSTSGNDGTIPAFFAGTTMNFQSWFRDANPGTTSNFSNAVEVTFL